MKISLIVEGSTERVLLDPLRAFLEPRIPGGMPRIDPVPQDGRLPKNDKLRRLVENLLNGRSSSDAVIALTDVYTGSNDFVDATDAKAKMRQWVGKNDRFYPHAAQYEFEAWLFPYWPTIKSLAGSNKTAPSKHPENVNHNKPPAYVLREVFLHGRAGRKNVKTRDARKILEGQDLLVAVQACPEMKALLNSFLILCNGQCL